jgi:glutamate transport system substrate-binding protein
MPRPRPTIAVLAGLLAATCASCTAGAARTVKPEAKPTPAPTSAVDRLKPAGTIKVGITFDQPGFGLKPSAGAEPTGFDVDIAKMVVARLGIQANKIQWVETVSKNTEKFLRDGTVDMVVATYPITDARRVVVGQAGPYDVTGVQILVPKNNGTISGVRNAIGKKICSVQGSSGIRVFQQTTGTAPLAKDTYSECIDLMLAGKVDAVAAYGDILLGYVRRDPDHLKIVGDTLDEGRFGIGYKKGDTRFCQLITKTLSDAFKNGTWKAAYERNLGVKGIDPPPPPTLDPCL